MRSQRLHMLNCNQHTEASDFLGGFRPARSRAASLSALRAAAAEAAASPLLPAAGVAPLLLPPSDSEGEESELSPAETEVLVSSLERAVASAAAWVQARTATPGGCGPEEAEALHTQLALLRVHVASASASAASARAPFQWADGPLVTAMRQGDMILVDEINLAEDAVLERLNRCEIIECWYGCVKKWGEKNVCVCGFGMWRCGRGAGEKCARVFLPACP